MVNVVNEALVQRSGCLFCVEGFTLYLQFACFVATPQAEPTS